MKRILTILTVLSSLISFAQDLNWETDLQTAINKANQNDKNILVYFTGSDWCSPCKQLKADFFENDQFLAQADKVILLKIDLPFRHDIITEEQRAKNKKVNEKYNKANSFPTLVALNKKGKEIDRIAAYSSLRDTTLHFQFLNRIIK